MADIHTVSQSYYVAEKLQSVLTDWEKIAGSVDHHAFLEDTEIVADIVHWFLLEIPPHLLPSSGSTLRVLASRLFAVQLGSMCRDDCKEFEWKGCGFSLVPSPTIKAKDRLQWRDTVSDP